MQNKSKVKAGICVAYDWAFLEHSLPAIYPYVTAICLSVDKDRKSWNGNIFEVDWNGFTDFIKKADVDKKISILEESFFNEGTTPIENECNQRRRMSEFLGDADWYLQIDTDEIIINAEGFFKELDKLTGIKRAVNIHGLWINLIKQTKSGFIYSVLKTPPLATNQPEYEYGRTNGHFNIYINTFLAHITWARPDEEVHYKLRNWGHSHEFDGMSFYKIWQALDDHNWRYVRDFHPMSKTAIDHLHFQKATNIKEFINAFVHHNHVLSSRELLQNNIWVSRFNKLIEKVKK